MSKQVFLELTSEENIKKLNIDPRLTDSFKRVMTRIQEYFDNHGYSGMVDYESILNEYLFPQEEINKDTFRQNEEFINALNHAKDVQKQLESIVSTKLDPIDDEQFLNDYIKKNYKVGFSFEVEPEKEQMHGGIYKDDLKIIAVKESLLTAGSDRLDETLCHEFIHFLTMCGKDKLSSVSQVMTPAIYEPLTEMLASDIIGVKPDGYARYCEFMKYINLLVGVDNYEYFIKRQLDPKYEEMNIPFAEIQDEFDKHRFHKEAGYLDEAGLNNVVYSAATQLIFREYDNIDDLTDDMIKIYSAPQLYSNIENLQELQDSIIDLYLSQKNITNPEVKNKIKLLIQNKNETRLVGNNEFINVSLENENYMIDKQGNLYLKRLNELFKLNQSGTLTSYETKDGILFITTTNGKYKCDLNNVDFNVSKENLEIQQEMIKKEIDVLMRGENMNRPYINQDTVSTVIARDTGERAEVLEQTISAPSLRKPYIRKETITLLHDKQKQYDIKAQKELLIAQKNMIQSQMYASQIITNEEVSEDENDMGMSL